MTQQRFIQLIPVHVFVVCLLMGWLAGLLVQSMVTGTPVVSAAGLLGGANRAERRTAVAANILAPVFTPEVMHWQKEIESWSAEWDLDPNLVATVMQIESCGAPNVVSRSGAEGLFQVMPFHFAEGEDMQDPNTNAARGLAYLASGLEKAGGDVGLALAGYNGGHSRISLDSSMWSEQTQRYWYWGTGIYAEAISGAGNSGRLLEWLQAGGASLCKTAAQQIGLNG